jgi:hypothetical protein
MHILGKPLNLPVLPKYNGMEIYEYFINTAVTAGPSKKQTGYKNCAKVPFQN